MTTIDSKKCSDLADRLLIVIGIADVHQKNICLRDAAQVLTEISIRLKGVERLLDHCADDSFQN